MMGLCLATKPQTGRAKVQTPDLLDSKAAVAASPTNLPLLLPLLPSQSHCLSLTHSLAHTVSESHIVWQTSEAGGGEGRAWVARWVVSTSLGLSFYQALSEGSTGTHDLL